jgi:hypothetical protein
MDAFDGGRETTQTVHGILSKKGHVVKNWRVRYFRLNFSDFSLKYFSGEDIGAPLKVLLCNQSLINLNILRERTS